MYAGLKCQTGSRWQDTMARASTADREPQVAKTAATGETPAQSDDTTSGSTPWQITVGRLLADRSVRITKDVAFGSHARLRCDIYEPEKAAAPTDPVVHFIYGGGWDTGEKACYRAIGSAFAAHGIRTVIGDYRLYPDVRFPDFNHDMAEAYAFTCQRFGPDAPAPVLVGHSAGAHIGALLTGDPRYFETLEGDVPRPSAFVGLAGPYAFDPTTWETTAHIFETTKDNPDVARPVMFADTSFPPTLLLHGSRDTLVTPNASVAMRDALADKDSDVTHKTYGLLGHAGLVMAMVRPLRWVTPVFNDVIAFVRAHGRPKATNTHATEAARSEADAPTA